MLIPIDNFIEIFMKNYHTKTRNKKATIDLACIISEKQQIYLIMGCSCVNKQITNKTESMLSSIPGTQFAPPSTITNLRTIKFSETTLKLSKIKAEHLIVFMDHSIDFSKNDHFVNMETQARKLEEHFTAYFDQSQTNIKKTSFATVDIMIPGLHFQKVTVVFCNIWNQERNNELRFRYQMEPFFLWLYSNKIKSLAITEFPSFLGIHLQRGIKRIMRELARLLNIPQIVKFCCLSNESKEIYMREIKQSKSSLIDSFTSIQGSAETDYF